DLRQLAQAFERLASLRLWVNGRDTLTRLPLVLADSKSRMLGGRFDVRKNRFGLPRVYRRDHSVVSALGTAVVGVHEPADAKRDHHQKRPEPKLSGQLSEPAHCSALDAPPTFDNESTRIRADSPS